MQKKLYNLYGFLFTSLVFIAMYALYIPNLLLQPNHFVFDLEGDGIKNYYASLYQALYGKGLHFNGMAYPSGDSFLFTDGMPLITLPIMYLRSNLPGLIIYLPAIINLLVLSAPIICTILVQRILKHYSISTIYSWLFAAGIALLSPQIERISAHQSLSFSYFIPACWLLIINIYKKTSWYNGLFYLLFQLAMAFFHPYYLAIGLVFYFIYLVVALFANKENIRKKPLKILGLITTGLLPLVLFQFFISATVITTTRVSIPWGYTFNRSAFKSIFFNVDSPLYFLQPHFLNIGKGEWEGASYLGFFAFPAFLFFIGYTIKQKFSNIKKPATAPIYLYLYTGILAYVFASSFPFYMPPLDEVLYLIPPLTQFRSTGRFAWILFYTFQVFAVVWLLVYFKGNTKIKTILAAIFLIVIYIEGIAHSAKRLNYVKQHCGINIFNSLEPNLGYANPKDFQAILPIKLFANGSEQMGLTHTNSSIKNAFWLSLKTGLPVIGFSMARVPLKTAMLTVQLASHPITPKKIVNYFPNKKPLLLLVSDTLNLTTGELDLIKRSKILLKDTAYRLYRLEIENINKTADEFKNILHSNTTNSYAIYTPLPIDTASKNPYPYYKYFTLATLPARAFKNFKDSIEFSVLTQKSGKFWGIPEILFEEYNKDGNLVSRYSSENKENYNITGQYIRLHYVFKPKDFSNTIKISLYAREFNFTSILFNEVNKPFYHKLPNTNLQCYNNFILE